MNPRIPKGEKAKNAGISLKPILTLQMKALAKKKGLSLSAYASMLFIGELAKAERTNLKKNRDVSVRGKPKIKRPR